MDCIDRIARALQYIEERLADEITLAEVAERANSSLYWFHRIFSSVVGESLGDYIRKRRLDCAAKALVTTRRRILDVALEYGFSSHEAFSRSFQRQFGMTPKTYRKGGIFAPRKNPVTERLLRRERKTEGGVMNTGKTGDGGMRIIELPKCAMITSKGHNLEEFNTWWSAVDKQRKDRFFPRDFMYFDFADKELVWLFAHYDMLKYDGKYNVVDFRGGLYAAAISMDGDDVDGERVVHRVKEWIKQTGYFELDETADRPVLFHVITSDAAFAKMKYRQLDIFFPIK